MDKEDKEPEKERTEEKSLNLPLWFFIGLIAFGIIAYLEGTYKFEALMGTGLLVLFFLITLAGGKNPRQALAMALVLIILGGIAYYFAWPYASPYVKSSWSLLKEGNIGESVLLPFQCLTGSEKCQSTFGEGIWQTDEEQKVGESIIRLNKQGMIIQPDPFSAVIPIEVKTEIPLNLEISCSADNTPIFAVPERLEFTKSPSIQQNSLTCSKSGGKPDRLSITIKTSVTANMSFPILIGKGESKGMLNAESKGPYTLRVKSSDAQPFSISKPISIIFEKPSSSDYKLSEISEFEILSASSKFKITCPEVVGGKEEISNKIYDNKLSLICNLELFEVPENPEKAYVELTTIYSVESNYNISLKS